MKKFYLPLLVAISAIAVCLAILVSSKLLYLLAIILCVLTIGFLLKSFAFIFPKGARNYVVIAYVALLEFFGLVLIYLTSFLSFFLKSFNTKVKKTPILLVHGYVNFSSVWLFHILRLKRKGYGPLFLINLGFPFSSIEVYAEKVKKKITEIQKVTKKNEIILIGHSMGGLVLSYFAEKYPTHADVKAIITLGSPLKGTKVAKIGIGKCCRQMEYKSKFIQTAKEGYPDKIMYHIVTKKDQLIIPYTSGIVNEEKSRNYIIDDLGHASLLYSTRVFQKIDYWLKKIS